MPHRLIAHRLIAIKARLVRAAAVIFLATAVFSSAAVYSAALPAEVTMTLNGSIIDTEAPPYVENFRTMAPVRFISEALGAKVDWDAEANLVSINAVNGVMIRLVIGETNMLVTRNGVESTIVMDVPAVTKDWRTFVPVRFIAEALGMSVDWDEATQTVSFTASLLDILR